MTTSRSRLTSYMLAASMATLIGAACGDGIADGGTPFGNGGYFAPLGSFNQTVGDHQIGSGIGGALAVGYRGGFYAFEGRGFYSGVSASDGPGTHFYGGSLDALLFPFLLPLSARSGSILSTRIVENTYVIAGAGGQDLRRYPGFIGTFGTTIFQCGIGDLIGFRWHRYEFALRAEVLYETGFRQQNPKTLSAGFPDTAPNHLNSMVINIGLQFPLGLLPRAAAEPPPVPAPVVVPVEQPAPTSP